MKTDQQGNNSGGKLQQFFRHNKWSILILVLAIVFILVGIFRANGREVITVLKKAINICMECIGLG